MTERSQSTEDRGDSGTPESNPEASWARSTSVFFFVVLLLAVGALSIFELSDPDLWWHLATGKWILANRSLPWTEPFTYAVPPTTVWYDTQWLFQIVVAVVQRIGGWNALIGLRVVWTCLFAVVLWGFARSRGFAPWVCFVAVLTAILASRYRFHVRPELFSFTLVALACWLYDRSSQTERLRLWPLIATQFAWANWHSSCVLGLFLGAAFIGCECTRALIGKDRRWRFAPRHLAVLGAGLVIATLLNPNAYQTPLLALTESKKTSIIEFQTPTIDFYKGASGVLLLFLALGWREVVRNNGLFWAAITAAFVYQAVTTNRFLPYLAALSPVFCAAGVAAIASTIKRIPKAPAIAAAVILGAAYLAAIGHGIRTSPIRSFTLGTNESAYPAKAAEFVLSEDLQGNMYNDFGQGGYLVWKFDGRRKVMIYGESRINAAMFAKTTDLGSVEKLRALLDETDIQYAILRTAIPEREGGSGRKGATNPQLFHRYLPEWKLVFCDDAASIFVRDTPAHADLIKRRASIILTEDIPDDTNPVPRMDLIEAAIRDPLKWPAVEAELRRGIEESPQHFRAALALGMAYDIHEKPEAALEAYRKAEALRPDSMILLRCLTRWHIQRGLFAEALSYQRRIAQRDSSVNAQYFYADLLARTGDRDAALDVLDKLIRKDPQDANLRQRRSEIAGSR